MFYLTIDTCTLRDASGTGDSRFAKDSLDLLKLFYSYTQLAIRVDQRKKILLEYKENIDADTFAKRWLSMLLDPKEDDPIRIDWSLTIPLTRITRRGVRVKLVEEHFH